MAGTPVSSETGPHGQGLRVRFSEELRDSVSLAASVSSGPVGGRRRAVATDGHRAGPHEVHQAALQVKKLFNKP